jgi:hypothetical protein
MRIKIPDRNTSTSIFRKLNPDTSLLRGVKHWNTQIFVSLCYIWPRKTETIPKTRGDQGISRSYRPDECLAG